MRDFLLNSAWKRPRKFEISWPESNEQNLTRLDIFKHEDKKLKSNSKAIREKREAEKERKRERDEKFIVYLSSKKDNFKPKF